MAALISAILTIYRGDDPISKAIRSQHTLIAQSTHPIHPVRILLVIAAELYRLSNSTPAQMIPPETKAAREKRYSLERLGCGPALDDVPSCCTGLVAEASLCGGGTDVDDAYRYAPCRRTADVGKVANVRVVEHRAMGVIEKHSLLILVLVAVVGRQDHGRLPYKSLDKLSFK